MKTPQLIDTIGGITATAGAVLLFIGIFIVMGRDIGFPNAVRIYVGMALCGAILFGICYAAK